MCVSKAKSTLETIRSGQEQPTPIPESDNAFSRFVTKIATAIAGEDPSDTAYPSSAQDYLKTYKDHGAFVLWGNNLGENYNHHAIAVFGVLEVPTATGNKIVVCGLDFNDQATDPSTTALRDYATKSPKSVCEVPYHHGSLDSVWHTAANVLSKNRRRKNDAQRRTGHDRDIDVDIRHARRYQISALDRLAVAGGSRRSRDPPAACRLPPAAPFALQVTRTRPQPLSQHLKLTGRAIALRADASAFLQSAPTLR